MPLKAGAIILSLLSLLLLGACGNNQTTNTENNSSSTQPPTTQSVETKPSANSAATGSTTSANNKNGNHGGQGGQVVETGDYHLELITLKEAEGIHLDFYLQKGDNHEAIPNAKVTAQVQLPDGSQRSFDMKYDASGKHYYTVLPTTATGDYKVAVLSDINGEKVNARYTVKQ